MVVVGKLSNAAFAMDHYTLGRGLSKIQAAGLIGNFMEESYTDLKIDAHGDKNLGEAHSAHGIGQWRDSRWAGCIAFAKKQNKSSADLTLQLDFVLHELMTTEKMAAVLLWNAKTIEDAVKAGLAYERPLGWTKQNPEAVPSWPKRLGYAQALMA